MTVTATVRPTGHPGYSETLPCSAESAAAARRLTRTALTAWGMDELAETGALIVSEFVANSVQHTPCHHVRVIVSRPTSGLVRIAVVDKSRTLPLSRAAGDGDEHGRGLTVVDALSWRWGTDVLRWGKRVWSELRFEAER